MRSNFIQLNRTFVDHDPTEDPEQLAVQSYLSEFIGTGKEKTWTDLLDHGCVVILGEPGSGKTWELEAQMDQLVRKNQFAFFLRLEELKANRVRDLLIGQALKNFEDWEITTSVAHFFLDARDEAQIEDYHGFESALRNFSNSLNENISRAQLVITSRIVGWRGAIDEDLLIKYVIKERQKISRIAQRDSKIQSVAGGQQYEPEREIINEPGEIEETEEEE